MLTSRLTLPIHLKPNKVILVQNLDTLDSSINTRFILTLTLFRSRSDAWHFDAFQLELTRSLAFAKPFQFALKEIAKLIGHFSQRDFERGVRSFLQQVKGVSSSYIIDRIGTSCI